MQIANSVEQKRKFLLSLQVLSMPPSGLAQEVCQPTLTLADSLHGVAVPFIAELSQSSEFDLGHSLFWQLVTVILQVLVLEMGHCGGSFSKMRRAISL